MSSTKARARVKALLAAAGVHIGGDAPTDVRVHDDGL